jgi:hypothetical protein
LVSTLSILYHIHEVISAGFRRLFPQDSGGYFCRIQEDISCGFRRIFPQDSGGYFRRIHEDISAGLPTIVGSMSLWDIQEVISAGL